MIFSHDTAVIALTALLVDAAIGWPDAFFRRIGHPVVWLGRLIAALDARLNRGRSRVARGGLAVMIVVAAAMAPALLAAWWLMPQPYGPMLLGVLAWPLVATRALYDHVAAVARPLQAGDMAAAKASAAMIVGRDLPDAPAPIARAAIESLAENASDGVVAPILWAAIAGLPGIAAYKAINTLDSMVGHMNPRHALFGRIAARLDDVVNLPASRLTGALIALSAASSAASRTAFRIMARDARRHRSPNAGWPEAAMAGALGVRLSGPRSYHGAVSDEPWLNGAARDPGPGDLRRALVLYRRSVVILGAGLALIVLI